MLFCDIIFVCSNFVRLEVIVSDFCSLSFEALTMLDMVSWSFSVAILVTNMERGPSNILMLMKDPLYIPDTIEPHMLSQGDLNDLVRDLYLTKNMSELLGSRLQQWKLLRIDVRITATGERSANLAVWFDVKDQICYCKDNPMVFRDEHGERFHHEISDMEDRFNGRYIPKMMGEYCWMIIRDTREIKASFVASVSRISIQQYSPIIFGMYRPLNLSSISEISWWNRSPCSSRNNIGISLQEQISSLTSSHAAKLALLSLVAVIRTLICSNFHCCSRDTNSSDISFVRYKSRTRSFKSH